MANAEYITILTDSLEKKVDLLRRLQVLTREQTEVLEDRTSKPDAFDEIVTKKGALIERLASLDKGFETVFERVEAELAENREQYAEEIRHMQELIRDITDRSTNLQVMEKRNSELVRERFGSIRKSAKTIRKSSKAVNAYYNNMNKISYDPQFMDRKK